MRHKFLGLGLFLFVCVTASRLAVAQQPGVQNFDRTIAPLIARHCLDCHQGEEPKGDLDLSTRTTAMAGGESGVAIVAGNLDDSLLWEHVDSGEMPPKKQLSLSEKKQLQTWIVSGAKWGSEEINPFQFSTDHRAGLDWWSLQPISQQQPPQTHQNQIDSFVSAQLAAKGLSLSAPAEDRILIRRLYFDLLGLPPTPQQIDQFLTDPAKDAYEKLVDRLLASPHYGERWARHWMDVVRFGESNGYEYDQPRNNSWHYRNWLIQAFNQDMPYNEFVERQLAADVLYPNEPDSFAATGFLVAGPHNTTLPSSAKMRSTMAQDELEDLTGMVGQTFLGLTVNCARCHDHKFDPISIEEYYQFSSTLAGVKHGERNLPNPTTVEQKQRLQVVKRTVANLQTEIEKTERPIRKAILSDRENGQLDSPKPPQPLATWEFDSDPSDGTGNLNASLVGNAKLKDGFLELDGKTAFAQTPPISAPIGARTLEAWVQLNNDSQRGGGVISLQTMDGVNFDAIVFGEREPKKWMAGSNGFVRTQPFDGEIEKEATSKPVHMAIVYSEDGLISAYRNGKPYGKPYRPGPIRRFEAGKAQIVFGLRHRPTGSNRMLAGKIDRARLYDRALSSDEVAVSANAVLDDYVTEAQILARLTPDGQAALAAKKLKLANLLKEKSAIENPPAKKIYTSLSNNPGVSHLLQRGNVSDPGNEVSPTGLFAVSGVNADFKLPPDAKEGDRRRRLANWITDQKNPLFSRVIVNRIWHYHFGQGLVSTPNDFGYNGGVPSHPALLDWLATELQRHDFRLKPIHRLMVTSDTYRQAAKSKEEAMPIDANNRLLWRKSAHRLEAESLRDAIVSVAGQLDPELGGIGYRDVREFKYKGSHFYEPLSELGTEKRRRTIYRFSPRGGRNPFLDTFDCPDPSTATPKRADTNTPLQALSMMNNDLIFQMSELLAQRVTRERGTDVNQQVARIYELAFGRLATAAEIEAASQFSSEHGLPALCRVIFNSNEFIFIQ